MRCGELQSAQSPVTAHGVRNPVWRATFFGPAICWTRRSASACVSTILLRQHYAARPEDHGCGAVAHHVDPIERSAERDGVDARHEKVGEQSFAPYFELFGSRQGGIESVDEFIAAAVAQLFDDPCGAQRHRIAVRDRPRCAAGDLVAQPPARFGQVGDAHGFETVAAELSGAGGEARREVGCFVLHD